MTYFFPVCRRNIKFHEKKARLGSVLCRISTKVDTSFCDNSGPIVRRRLYWVLTSEATQDQHSSKLLIAREIANNILFSPSEKTHREEWYKCNTRVFKQFYSPSKQTLTLPIAVDLGNRLKIYATIKKYLGNESTHEAHSELRIHCALTIAPNSSRASTYYTQYYRRFILIADHIAFIYSASRTCKCYANIYKLTS